MQPSLFGHPRTGRFRTLLTDPPWMETGGGQVKRGADRHYPLLPTREIPHVIGSAPNWDPAADAHLYLWATNNFLEDGLWVMAQLGFRYVTNVVWVKDRAGLGQYFRGRHELMLFGVRGRGLEVATERKDLPTVLEAPRGRHSAKPPASYDLIEARSQGPYAEVFARSRRPGWSSWGNEVTA